MVYKKNKKFFNNILCSILCAFLTLSSPCAQGLGAEEFVWRKVEHNAFVVGEYLRYVLRWGIIHGGYSTMEVTSIVPISGRSAYHLVSKTRSNGFFDTFYKVRDLNQSWIDVESVCSHQFSKNIREGRYRKKERIEYNHVNRTVTIFKKNRIVKGVITPFIQDVLSSLYYVRTQPLKVGHTFSIEVNTSGKNWLLVVNVYRKEKVQVPVGSFDCFVVEPRLAEEGIFETKGKIWVWMTDDERHLPVRMRTKIKIGSITADLISTERHESDDPP